LLTLHFG